MFYGFDFHCSFPELIKIKRSNPLVCYQQPVPHQLNHVRTVILHTQSRLTLVLEIPETDLLLASKNQLPRFLPLSSQSRTTDRRLWWNPPSSWWCSCPEGKQRRLILPVRVSFPVCFCSWRWFGRWRTCLCPKHRSDCFGPTRFASHLQKSSNRQSSWHWSQIGWPETWTA